jgi:hypothetical protein
VSFDAREEAIAVAEAWNLDGIVPAPGDLLAAIIDLARRAYEAGAASVAKKPGPFCGVCLHPAHALEDCAECKCTVGRSGIARRVAAAPPAPGGPARCAVTVRSQGYLIACGAALLPSGECEAGHGTGSSGR